MIERLTHRSKYGIAYAKIPTNPSNMVDVGECYTGRIIDRLAGYEDTGLTPEQIKALQQENEQLQAQAARMWEALEEATETIENIYERDTPQTEKYRDILNIEQNE